MDYEDCEDLKDRCLCSDCIGEAFLKSDVQTHGQDAVCDYCAKSGKTFRIGALCERVAQAFEQNYARASDDDGDPVIYAIQNAADIPEDAAKDIQQVLEYENEPAPGDYTGEESEFSSELFYAEHSNDGADWHQRWREFERTLKTEARFFSQTCETRLRDVFDGIELMKTAANEPLIIDAGPGTRLDAFFRARVIEGEDSQRAAIERPDREIGPPPSHLAKDGRMNARGISVFYGSGDVKTALAEVRPPVGATVVTARFRVIRPLRLLDLTALGSVKVTGSVFDPAFAPRFERVTFLRSLSQIMTRPVLPSDEAFAYLATQAVADFLASRPAPPIDGILFPSVQTKSNALNVVLFQKAAKVKPIDLPPNTKLWSSLYEYSDEGIAPDYTVYEELPAPDEKLDDDFSIPLFGRGLLHSPTDDNRDDTLEVDVAEVAIHFITGLSFDTSDVKVTRQRYQQYKRPKNTPF